MRDLSEEQLQQGVASFFLTNWQDVSPRAKALFDLENRDGLLRFLTVAERAAKWRKNRFHAREARRQFAISRGYGDWADIKLAELIRFLDSVPDAEPVRGCILLRVVEKLQHIENRGKRRIREEKEAKTQRRLAARRLQELAEQDQLEAEARDDNLAECERYKHLEIRTKKEARRLGYLSAKELNSYHRKTGRRPMAPLIGEQPIGVKDDLFWRPEQCEKLMSVAEGERLGLRLFPGTEPVLCRHAYFGKAVTYAVYRESDFEPIQNK